MFTGNLKVGFDGCEKHGTLTGGICTILFSQLAIAAIFISLSITIINFEEFDLAQSKIFYEEQ